MNINKEMLDDIEKRLAPDYEKDSEDCKQPGPPPAPFSLNNRLIVETYQKGGLEAKANSGFATVSQKVSVKGLKVLMDADISNGKETYRSIRKGDVVYIKEELLHTAPWAAKALECEGVEGKFLIVDLTYVEFVVPK